MSGFASEIATVIDKRVAVDAGDDNPLAAMIKGDHSGATLNAFAEPMWRWLLVAEQGLLPRALRNPPDLPTGIRLAPVLSRAFGGGELDKTHATAFTRLLDHFELPYTEDVDDKGVSHWDDATWLEGMAAVFTQRALGGAVCGGVVAALQEQGVPEPALAYFAALAETGAADARLLAQLIGEWARSDEEKKKVTSAMEAEMDAAPLRFFAARLTGDIKKIDG